MIDDRFASMLSELKELRETVRSTDSLKSGGGGGTSSGMTDDWKASVDHQLGQIHNDLRSMLRNGVAAIVALAAMLAGLYFYIDVKDDARMTALHEMKVEQTKMSTKLDAVLELRGERGTEKPTSEARQ